MPCNTIKKSFIIKLLLFLCKPSISKCKKDQRKECIKEYQRTHLSNTLASEVKQCSIDREGVIVFQRGYLGRGRDSYMLSNFYLGFSFLIILLYSLSSCKKFVTIDPPPTQLVNSTVYGNDASAISAMSSVYTRFAVSDSYLYSMYLGYSSDEFNNTSSNANDIQFYTNGLQSSNTVVGLLWSDPYKYIYQANAVLEGVGNSATVSTKVRNQLTGEAKFIRAFLYFYLVNCYGDVPLVTSTDYNVNALASKQVQSSIYQQILADLKDAEMLLSATYIAGDVVSPSSEKLRPTKAAARALLARVYLYMSDMPNAEAYATAVISSNIYSLVTADLTKVFAKNSSEAIWQISTSSTFNTYEGFYFVATTTPKNVSLSTSLLGAFEALDKRRTNWVGTVTVGTNTYLFPYKYRVQNSTTVSEYTMILRYAELFLIRAEAYAGQNKLTQAIADINVIRSRAGITPLASTLNQAQVLAAIEQERRIELFSEWGDRWVNLKRTGRLDAIMAPAAIQKGGSWNSNYKNFPIPISELNADPNLKQNDGYN